MNKSEDEKLIKNPDVVPTKELLKLQRKKAYEKAKADRKNEKIAQKEKAKIEREAERSEKDKKLWEALKKGSDLK